MHLATPNIDKNIVEEETRQTTEGERGEVLAVEGTQTYSGTLPAGGAEIDVAFFANFVRKILPGFGIVGTEGDSMDFFKRY